MGVFTVLGLRFNHDSRTSDAYGEKGADHISPLFVLINGIWLRQYRREIGAQNICATIVTACSSGANAIGEAYRQIKENRATVMVTGGSKPQSMKLGLVVSRRYQRYQPRQSSTGFITF